MQNLVKFDEGYKACIVCREKKVKAVSKGPREKQKKHNERTNTCKTNNPEEKVRKWRHNRMSRIKDEIFTCPNL